MRPIVKGSTDQSVIVRIVDAADGTPETGVVFNSAGLDMWYRREGGLEVAITEATLAAVNTAHSDGGFIHISDGYYRIDLPDAAVASGANGVMVAGAMTDMVVIGCYVPLWDINPYDAVRAGLTALPNAAADAAGGLPISDTGGLDLDDLKADVTAILADTGTDGVVLANDAITAAKIAADAIGSSELAASAVTEIAAAIASPSINTTTIATLASQTSFTLTAGSADDNAYNGCLVVVTDASTAVQKAVGVISDYTGSTKTVTLLTDPAIFTMAAGDTIEIRPDRSLKPTVDNRNVVVAAAGGVEVGTIITAALTTIADAVLLRDWTAIVATIPERCLLKAARFLRNKWSSAGGTITVTEEDDTTESHTFTQTTASGDPTTGLTPD